MCCTVVITRVAYKMAQNLSNTERKGKTYFYFSQREIVELNFSRHPVRFHFVADSVKSGISCEILLGLQHISIKSHH